MDTVRGNEVGKVTLSPCHLVTLSSCLTAWFLALVFIFLSHQQLWHTDVWGHLRFGEYIVTEHQLPEHEMFSGDFADQTKPYLNFQWLTQAGNYLVYELGVHRAGGDAKQQLAGGALALTTEHALIVTLRLLVLWFAFRRLTGSAGFALAGIVTVFVLSLDHAFVHRPQALGQLAFAALLVPLSRPMLSRRAVVLIPIVMVLWANCHGSFPMGFVLLGAFVVGRGLGLLLGSEYSVLSTQYPVPSTQHGGSGTRYSVLGTQYSVLGGRLWHDAQLRRLALALLLSLLAVAFLNPHGPNLYRYSVEMQNHPNIKFMEEWKPLPIKSTSGYLFLLSFALLAPLVRFSRLRFTPTQVLLLLGFGLQSLAHVRVLVWWAMIVVWVGLPHAQSALERFHLLPRRAGTPTFAKAALTVAAALAGLLLSAPGLWATSLYRPGPEKRVTDVTPYHISAYLKEQYAKDPQLKRCIFTSETIGDYLLWDLRLEPPVRIFCYSHVHLLTAEHWRECMQVKFGDAGWEKVLDRHGVQFLIVENMQLYDVLMEEVRADPERWQVISKSDEPIFLAKRR
jgi:hypothetical protein